MKYLFFDIESPNGRPYAMCEFGYALYDENLNLLKEEVLLMNPSSFFIIRRLEKENIKFKFKISDYTSKEEFPFYYEQIKNILLDKDVLIFGFSVNNDLLYLMSNCERYQLEKFSFDAYDVQTLYKIYYGGEYKSLEKIANELLNEDERNELKEHYSVDDAKMTCNILKKIIENNSINIQEVIKKLNPKNSINCINSVNASRNKKMKAINKNKKIYLDFISNYKKSELSKQSCFIMDGVFKNENNVINSINFIKRNNYVPVKDGKNCDIVIVAGNKDLVSFKFRFNKNIKNVVFVERIKSKK